MCANKGMHANRIVCYSQSASVVSTTKYKFDMAVMKRQMGYDSSIQAFKGYGAQHPS